MMFKRLRNLRYSDVAILCGLAALIVFGHLATDRRPANAAGLNPLLMQGSGGAYSQPVNARATEFEYNARNALYQLGAAEASYALYDSSGTYADLRELRMSGYIQPNQTGRSLVANYSITFYLPPSRKGYSLIAEPENSDLRPFMVTENQRIVLLTPSVLGDPNVDWTTVRAMETELILDEGRYGFLSGLQLVNYDPPLHIRLNNDRSAYLLHSFNEVEGGGFNVDDSLVYVSSYASYMIGDTREFEE